ncbi:MAG: zinc-ribbon domain-containing protein [Ruminococcaceae bacterium]|nr:zinc-ribbon domain-containing protein [Oscillospiraceae bacterium]
MFCPKCGKELSSDVRFCSGCGNPIATSSGEEAPAERSTIERAPVSDKPVFIPEPAKASNNKKFITIGIAIAMIVVLVLGFLKYQDLNSAEGFEGRWKLVGNSVGSESDEESYAEISGNKIKLIEGNDVQEYTLEGNTFFVSGIPVELSIKNNQLVMCMSAYGQSVEMYLERAESANWFEELLIYIIAFAVLLIALIFVNMKNKGVKKAVPVGTYSGNTESLTVSADKTMDVTEPSVPVEEPASYATETVAPAEESAPVSYPAEPAAEEKKESSGDWFTSAGDL